MHAPMLPRLEHSWAPATDRPSSCRPHLFELQDEVRLFGLARLKARMGSRQLSGHARARGLQLRLCALLLLQPAQARRLRLAPRLLRLRLPLRLVWHPSG